MLKNIIQLSKLEGLVGFIKQFINLQHSTQQPEGLSGDFSKWKAFYRQKESETKKLKDWIISGQEKKGGPIKQMPSPVLTRKIHTDWLRIPLLGEGKTTVRLVIKFWFGDVAQQK